MKNYLSVTAIVVLMVFGCTKSKDVTPKVEYTYNSSSYLPMTVGNYWKINEQNYTEIIDTATINHSLFYKFYSLIGGDADQIRYLRIDSRNRLIEKYPSDTSVTYVHADFNATLGSQFNTLSNSTNNTFQVTLIKNSNDTLTFELVNVLNNSSKSTKSYKKGVGFADKWKEVKLGETTYLY